jgi:hypothetical protein
MSVLASKQRDQQWHDYHLAYADLRLLASDMQMGMRDHGSSQAILLRCFLILQGRDDVHTGIAVCAVVGLRQLL